VALVEVESEDQITERLVLLTLAVAAEVEKAALVVRVVMVVRG
jgi:hypothetical protein